MDLFVKRCALALGLFTATFTHAIVPNVVYEDKVNWDWAAASAMILDVYGVYVNQHEIAEWATPGLSDYGISLWYTSGTIQSVATILQHFGNITSTRYDRPLTAAEIAAQINAGRPVLAQLAYSKSLIVGFSGDSVNYIAGYPGGGSLWTSLSNFTNTYTWLSTLVLETPVPSSRPAILIPEDQIDPNMTVYAFDQLFWNDYAACYSDKTTTTSHCQSGSGWQLGYYNQNWSYGVVLGAGTQIGNTETSGPAFLRDYSGIEGRLDMTDTSKLTIQNQVTVTGGIHQTAVPYRGFGAGTPDFSGVAHTTTNIEPNQSRLYLAPGKYWNYNIKANSPVQLSSGIYYFNELICDGCTIEVNAGSGPVRIYVQNALGQNQGEWKFVGGDETDLLLAYLGTSTVYFNANFSGTLLAPSGTLVLGQTGKNYVGQFQAKHLTVHQQSVVRHSRFQ